MSNGHHKVNVPQTDSETSPLAFPIQNHPPVPQAKDLGVKTHIQSMQSPVDSILKMYTESNHFYHLQTQATVISLLGCYNSLLNSLLPSTLLLPQAILTHKPLLS